jgi:hypothetical protein
MFLLFLALLLYGQMIISSKVKIVSKCARSVFFPRVVHCASIVVFLSESGHKLFAPLDKVVHRAELRRNEIFILF